MTDNSGAPAPGPKLWCKFSSRKGSPPASRYRTRGVFLKVHQYYAVIYQVLLSSDEEPGQPHSKRLWVKLGTGANLPSEANKGTLPQSNKTAFAKTAKPLLRTSALSHAPRLRGEPPRAALPPAAGRREASGAPCACPAARPGTRWSRQPSPWRSRSTRCGPPAGTGNSAGPDAWGGEKSAYLQHRGKTFSLIERDTASSEDSFGGLHHHHHPPAKLSPCTRLLSFVNFNQHSVA